MTGFAFFVNVNTFSIVVNSMDPGDFDAYCAAFRSTKTIVEQYFQTYSHIFISPVFSDFDKGNTGKISLHSLQVFYQF